MTSPWVTEQGWEPVICAPLVLLLWWTTINLSEFCCLTLAEVITCLALLLTTIIVMSPHYNTAMQLRLSSGHRGYPETCFLGTTPCLGCHSNSMVDLGGVWGLLLVEVECCIKNDGCSVNDQFSSLIVALLFSFLLSPFLNIPPPSPLIIPLSFPPCPPPLSLERVNTDSQLVPPPSPPPPPLQSPPPSSHPLPPPSLHPTLQPTDRKQEATLPCPRWVRAVCESLLCSEEDVEGCVHVWT